MQRIFCSLVFLLTAGGGFPLHADEVDQKYPYGDQLRVLADDVASPAYRELTEKMLSTDLQAEWQRVETEDNGGLFCHDFEGEQLWHHVLPGFNTTWGTAVSPLIYQDKVFLIHDQNKADPLFVALDKQTGKLLWQGVKRAKAMGWSTPVVVRVGDHDELIYPGGETIKAYDPANGKELWTLAGPTREVIPTILVGPQFIYTASGRQGPTIALRPGGHGDVTSTHLASLAVRGGPLVPSPILVNGRIFTVNDTGIATCLDAQTGQQIWQARVRDLFSASPIESSGLLYFCAESGTTFVLRAADKFEIVAQNDLGSPILASPAALSGRLYIRTAEALVCIGG